MFIWSWRPTLREMMILIIRLNIETDAFYPGSTPKPIERGAVCSESRVNRYMPSHRTTRLRSSSSLPAVSRA